MPTYTDQTGRKVHLPSIPRRIISLVPSQTEFLYDIGLRDQVVGITKFCIHPKEWHRSKTRVGGTKQIHPSIIESLHPDLVIANREENAEEQVMALANFCSVWVTDVSDLPGAYTMMEQLGTICGHRKNALEMIERLKNDFSQLPVYTKKPRTCYCIWREPWMTVGGDTFIQAMMEAAGLDNIFKEQRRYPVFLPEALRDMDCELLLLSSEPYPFRSKHLLELQELLPATRIELVDGELFSWYGSRLLQTPEYLLRLRTMIDRKLS